MANQEPNWDDLGSRIEQIIDRAVNSRDYQKLNQTIRQAVETGSAALRKAMENASQPTAGTQPTARPQSTVRPQPVPLSQMNTHVGRPVQRTAPVPSLYASTTPQILRGIAETAAGGLLVGVNGTSLVLKGIINAAITHTGFLTFQSVMGILLLVCGGFLLKVGSQRLCRIGRFRQYKAALGKQTHCEVSMLSRIVGKTVKFVRKDLRKLIGDGLFLEGHLDTSETSLIVSNETYQHYRRLEERQKAEALEEAKEQKLRQGLQPQVREVLEQGSTFLRDIRACNERIPGEEISAKISRMEMIVEKIFDRAKARPEVVPDLKKLLDYYLPMTVKLLNAYAEMDAQPIQGDTIAASKREIEETLDTLNNAFEKLLDQVFKEMAVDVSSDISVLQTLLAQEGLTDDGLT